MSGQLGLDLDPATAERAEDISGNAIELGEAVTDGRPSDLEFGCQPCANHGLIQAPGGHRVRVDWPRVERAPATVRPQGHVRHDGMCVQLRIPRPRRAMAEGRRDEPLRAEHLYTVAPPSHPDGTVLEIVERSGHGLVMGAAHSRLDHGVADAEQQAHALRRGERQVDGGVALRPSSSTQKIAAQRMLARERAPQSLVRNRARQAKPPGPRADPCARRPPRFAVVVLGTPRLCAASTRPCAVPT